MRLFLGTWYETLGDNRRFIAECRREASELCRTFTKTCFKLKLGGGLQSASAVLHRHLRKHAMYHQTLERAPPAEHPALVTGSREQYQESMLTLLASSLSISESLPLALLCAHARAAFSTLLPGSSSRSEVENISSQVKCEKEKLACQKNPIELTQPKLMRVITNPPIVVNLSPELTYDVVESKTDNNHLKSCDNKQSQPSLVSRLHNISLDVRNTKDSMILSTSQAIKRLV